MIKPKSDAILPLIPVRPVISKTYVDSPTSAVSLNCQIVSSICATRSGVPVVVTDSGAPLLVSETVPAPEFSASSTDTIKSVASTASTPDQFSADNKDALISPRRTSSDQSPPWSAFPVKSSDAATSAPVRSANVSTN